MRHKSKDLVGRSSAAKVKFPHWLIRAAVTLTFCGARASRLVEGDADSLFLAPHHPARPANAFRHQSELGGIPTGLYIQAAPVSERFRIVQSKALLPNSILAPFSTRCRGAIRLLSSFIPPNPKRGPENPEPQLMPNGTFLRAEKIKLRCGLLKLFFAGKYREKRAVPDRGSVHLLECQNGGLTLNSELR